jgi:CheY-like chemotaxis protein
MDEATAARIFEPFFTSGKEAWGTGLGLATVYGLVRQHEGHIWVDSELGRGTTFEVYLPTVDATGAELTGSDSRAEPQASTMPSGTAPSVLVVDDADLMRTLLDRVLTDAGYRVLLAASGEEAMEIWERERDTIALLLTDVAMPGMSGEELIAELRATRPDLRVICTSGYSDDILRERGSLPERVTFLEKPFSANDLCTTVGALLVPADRDA